ncbi:hypothetical protein POK33_39160 [Burkholderia cenocepacia]|uniref:hypothetical protein n=1 Tax=Burkholderia cenocepacia TaxID=95486 RepID=UPI0023B994E2|nr:hypothetical protein [Burkholderia cenocepacia]MDF0506775.1 hypothetical protein [Burkholderia cenocepacia]
MENDIEPSLHRAVSQLGLRARPLNWTVQLAKIPSKLPDDSVIRLFWLDGNPTFDRRHVAILHVETAYIY